MSRKRIQKKDVCKNKASRIHVEKKFALKKSKGRMANCQSWVLPRHSSRSKKSLIKNDRHFLHTDLIR